MNPQQWRRVCDLLDSYSGLALPEKERRLLSLPAEDPIVVAEALRLARAESTASRFLTKPIANLASLFSQPSLSEGSLIANRFRIVGFLGAGGMGEVYEALDLQLGESIALKVLRDDLSNQPELVRMFQREVQLSRRVTHANVCRIFDLGSDDSVRKIFLTMELLRGGTLAARLPATGVAPPDCLNLIHQLVAGLAAAHRAGVLHRDLKPGNILFREPGHFRACLCDFGLALPDPNSLFKSSGIAETQLQGIAGTPPYMAPECFEGQAPGAPSDVYALGLVIHEILTGQLPFGEYGPLASIVQRCRKIPPDPPLPAPLVHLAPIMRRCLDPDQDRRYPDATAIEEALSGNHRPPAARFSRRSLLRTGAAVALVSPFGLGIRYWLRGRYPPGGRIILMAPVEAPAGSGLDAIEVALSQSLLQSGVISLWDRNRLPDVLSRMGRPGGAEDLDPPGWREVALREHVPLVLFGSVARAGDGLALTLRLEQVNASTPRAPERSWQRSFDARNRTELFDAGHESIGWLRGLLGESAVEIQQSGRPPQDITTNSWDALAAFHRGEQRAGGTVDAEALLDFEAAIRHDPEFTIAWMRKGDILMGIKRMNEGLLAWDTAIRCARKRPLTRREDLTLRAMFADDTGDYRLSEKLFAEFAHFYPNESWGYFNRTLPLMNLGLFDEAIATLEQCRRFPERHRAVTIQLCQAHVAKRSYAEASRYVAALLTDGSPAWSERCAAGIFFSQGEYLAARQALHRSKAAGNPQWGSEIELYELAVLPNLETLAGCLVAARNYAESDLRLGLRMSAAMKMVVAACFAAGLGQAEQARALARRANSLDESTTVAVRAGSILARLGYRDDVRPLLRRVELPLDIPRVRAARHRLQGELLLSQCRFGEALAHLDKARADEIQPYGHEYWAHALARAGRARDAEQAYLALDATRNHQLRLLYPEPPFVRWTGGRC